MAAEKKYLFGPVPSRRLGLSLGADIVPLKTCTQNCLYCQLGVHADQVLTRQSFVKVEDVISELEDTIAQGLNADYITFSGSGEPTLNIDMSTMIDQIRHLTDIKVAIITNGTLLNDPQVRADCCKADVVLPSLDAGDARTFQLINRPHQDITFDALVDGLCRFRAEYAGQIWLELFFIEGINTAGDQIAKISDIIGRIRPDKIQLNTAVRPTADKTALRVDESRLRTIAAQLGPRAEVVADFSPLGKGHDIPDAPERILEMLKRRPCSTQDICRGLGVTPDTVKSHIDQLLKQEKISAQTRAGTEFFVAKQTHHCP